MRDGFIKVAAGTPKIRVADCVHNAGQVIALMKDAAEQGVKVLASMSRAAVSSKIWARASSAPWSRTSCKNRSPQV